MDNDFEYKITKPDKSIIDFVESFWFLKNTSDKLKDIVVLPDGRIDLFFSYSPSEAFDIMLSGLETHADQASLAAGTVMFAISFKLLATEYILQSAVSQLLDNAKALTDNFWDFNKNDLDNFEQFCDKASRKIQSLLPLNADNRKLELFELIYESNGALSVTELSEKVFWSSRQINRYFKDQFGLSLKAYCNILRFRASFTHIKEGKLFPQENFADQSHFIKQVKKLSGVSPKELKKNVNDRFIQFSTLHKK